MRIPTRDEINVFGSLDEEWACQNFLGKDLDEAERLFADSSVYEDLMWMGPVAFRFYVPAADRYLRSEASAGDCEAALFLLAPLESRLEQEPEEVRPVAGLLASLCQYMAEHGEKFDAAELADRYVALWNRFSSLME
jgi:hypothetical protein